MPSRTFRFTGIIGGLYAAANIFDQPQGTVPRLSNLVFTERGGLLTVDGTHVVSRPAPSPPPKGFISSGAISSSQPPAPTLRSSTTFAAANNGTGFGGPGSVPISVDVATPMSLQVGDLIVAIVLNQSGGNFSSVPPVTPPSTDWKLGAQATSIGRIQMSIYTLTVAGDLPSTLTFETVPDSSVLNQAISVVLVPLTGANGANPVDHIAITFGVQVGGANTAPSLTTSLTNDLILVAMAPTLSFSSWGGIITPGTPAGTSEIALLQTSGQTMAVWDQDFVGPGPTGAYVSPSGWSSQTGLSSVKVVIAIAAGFPNDGDIEGFEPTDDLTITPDPVITGASTLLSAPQGLFFDINKQLWIADAQSGSLGGIFMYKSPAQDTGDRAPDLVIQGSNAGLVAPQDVVVDDAGLIYVANFGTLSQAGFVAIYPNGSSGNVAPSTVISGANTTLVNPVGVAVDPFGSIYVIDATQNAVIVFAAGEGGNIFPSRVISGSNTLIFNPQAIRFDNSGNLWVAVGKTVNNPAYLLTFAPDVGGNAFPANILGSTALQPISGNGGPSGLSFDTGANIFVAVYKNAAVLKFNAGSTGAATPAATLTGWINGPWGIAIPH